jgi:hypothetical protein
MTLSAMMTSTVAATDSPTMTLARRSLCDPSRGTARCRSASTSTSMTSSQMIPQIAVNDHSSQFS